MVKGCDSTPLTQTQNSSRNAVTSCPVKGSRHHISPATLHKTFHGESVIMLSSGLQYMCRHLWHTPRFLEYLPNHWVGSHLDLVQLFCSLFFQGTWYIPYLFEYNTHSYITRTLNFWMKIGIIFFPFFLALTIESKTCCWRHVAVTNIYW